MILLDTDHLTLLSYSTNPRCQALIDRMNAPADREIGTTIISVEEQWRGWFAFIARHRDVRR
jgi:tRNA(fMet)-specific endonuclease VapC